MRDGLPLAITYVPIYTLLVVWWIYHSFKVELAVILRVVLHVKRYRLCLDVARAQESSATLFIHVENINLEKSRCYLH